MAAPPAYQNPLRAIQGLTPERVDQGVDYSGTGNLYALGPGVIENVSAGGWPGGVFIQEQLANGGPSVYYAEDIHPDVKVGQSVDSNTVLGQMYNGGSGIEMGWANPNAGMQQAMGHSQWSEGGASTAYGADFNALLTSLGAPGGQIHGTPVGSVPQGFDTLSGQQGAYMIGAAPGITSANIDKFGASFQAQYLQQLATANQAYANQSAQFQQANLNLSQNDLNTQLSALNRLLGSKGKPGEYLQNYQLRRQQLERQMTQQQNEAVSSGAASGSSFTHGTQENLANIKASRATQEQQQQIAYNEQIASAHDRQKTLFDLAERYGISREQISARLQNQLANIQYSTDAGVSSLAMQMAQDDATIGQLAQMPVYPQAAAGVP